MAPPPDVCVSYVKISGSGAGSQNARALGVRVGDRLVAVTSRSLGPTPDARDAAIDLAAGRPERGAQCHPLAALRWRRGVGGAALTKVSANTGGGGGGGAAMISGVSKHCILFVFLCGTTSTMLLQM